MNGEGIARYQRCGGPGASIRRKNAKELQLIACWKIENMCKCLQLTTYAEASVCPTGPTPHHFNPSRNSDRQTPPTNLSSPWYNGYHGPTIPAGYPKLLSSSGRFVDLPDLPTNETQHLRCDKPTNGTTSTCLGNMATLQTLIKPNHHLYSNHGKRLK